MTAPADPYQTHLDRAEALFRAGDAVQAGQIWQAILKRSPDHSAARAGLLRVRQVLDPQDLGPGNDALLQEGCTLYDMGEVREALATWERILANDPRHRLALSYANDARRELGLPGLPVPPGPPAEADPPRAAPEPRRAVPEPPRAASQPVVPAAAGENPRERAEELVQEGVQIFDMGMAEEAIAKWERALELNPGHPDAPKYLAMARRDQGRAPVIAPKPVPEHATIERDALILRAEQLLREGRVDDADRAFRQLLERDPQHPRILRGYHQVRALQATRVDRSAAPEAGPAGAGPAARVPGEGRTPEGRTPDGWTHDSWPPHGQPAIALAEPPPPHVPVDPPKPLTERAPAPRDGIHLPRQLERWSGPRWLRTRPRWLRSRRAMAIAAGSAAVVLAGLMGYGLHQRERALREAVASAKVDALRPVSRMVQIPQLAEATEAIRREGEQSLGDDPLLAYFRAQELQRRDPDDPAAAHLLQQAHQQMTAQAPSGDLAGFDRNLQHGDLEDARTGILGLLRQDPDNPDLRDRGRRLFLALAPLYATQGHMGKAQAALQYGRAMFPRDPSWQARLKLLEAIQAMPSPERAAWIPLLG